MNNEQSDVDILIIINFHLIIINLMNNYFVQNYFTCYSYHF